MQAAGARAASLATGVLRTSLAPLAPAPASKAATTHLGCQMSKWGAWGGVAMLSVQTQQGWCGAPCTGFATGMLLVMAWCHWGMQCGIWWAQKLQLALQRRSDPDTACKRRFWNSMCLGMAQLLCGNSKSSPCGARYWDWHCPPETRLRFISCTVGALPQG